MGNQLNSGSKDGSTRARDDITDSQTRHSIKESLFHNRASTKRNSACLVKLFEKLELTADEKHRHPGELSRTTFENAFHGPLHKFGKLLYIQMSSHHSHHDRERITREQFVKAGKELLKMFDDATQLKYYFKLFAAGRDSLNKEDAAQMVDIAYALTLSASTIPYSRSHRDKNVFDAMVESMFGINEKMNFEEFKKWSHNHCPHIFCGVHNWVYTIMTGSKMPSEQESAPVPLLERFIEDKYCMSMGMLWALSAVIPACYTHTDSKETEQEKQQELATAQGVKNPLLTSFHLIMKLARLTRCQSWTLLYDSNDHGLSLNRFSHHVSSYHGPTITLFSFEGRNVFCVAEDQGWREGTNRIGGQDTMFLQITPVFRVIQAGGPMVLWSEHSRGLRPGIGIGKDAKSQVLFLPSDFERIEHYDVACELDKIEVWGCGTTAVKEAQIKQKDWEKKETERQATRKLRLEPNWNENPDKQILTMAGINTEHQYSREGGW